MGSSTHGGSGRVGVVGRFQVKGIGATPLVGLGTEWIHAHGAVGMEEALAEAAIGEVVSAEFPHGGVPVIAVLDTGLMEHLPTFMSGSGGRRALIIRPAMLRPAHFERAPFFVESASGYKNEALEDAKRVRDAIFHFLTISAAQRESLNLPADIFELAVRLGEQAAFGDAHRLFSGGFFSSNLALDGAVMDYGVMRSFSTWRKVKIHAHTPGFGGDIHVLKSVFKSLTFYFNKNKMTDQGLFSTSDLIATVVRTYYKSLHRNLSSFFGRIESDDPVLIQQIGDNLLQYFLTQQKTIFQYDWKSPLNTDEPWLGTALVTHPAGTEPSTMEQKTLHDIEELLCNRRDAWEGKRARTAFGRGTAIRYLSSRYLTRESLRDSLYATAISSDPEVRPEAKDVETTLTNIVGRARRHWKNLPSHLQVRAQTCVGGSSALWCLRYPDGCWVLWIEGIRTSTTMYFFNGRWLSLPPDLVDIHPTSSRWSAALQMEPASLDFATTQEVPIFGQMIRIPPMQYIYPEFLNEREA